MPMSGSPHPWSRRTPAKTKSYGRFLSEAVFLRFVGEHREFIDRIKAEAFRDEVLLTSKEGAQALVRPDYEADEHAIHFFADPRDKTGASAAWCEMLYGWLTREAGGSQRGSTVGEITENQVQREPEEVNEPGACVSEQDATSDSGGGAPKRNADRILKLFTKTEMQNKEFQDLTKWSPRTVLDALHFLEKESKVKKNGKRGRNSGWRRLQK